MEILHMPPSAESAINILKTFQKMLNCKIKLIKTAKLLFGHFWAIYCHIGKDESNTSLLKKKKKKG